MRDRDCLSACGEQTLRNPSFIRGITERFRSMGPPLWGIEVAQRSRKSRGEDTLSVRVG
ncbi:uncharacterised protein [Saccharolobus solfataricus]|uniref:Uncharacterized protein n=1 Tax=Saccharolobus solfataricus TaxID=2287 RepID=A0A157T1R8_SACSO|nr:uncharacterised protein [Saccharolobus solfataricus]